MRILLKSIWNTAFNVRSAALVLMIVFALSMAQAQEPTQSVHSAPVPLPQMYEYAFTFQAATEKLASEREEKGGDGSAFREILRLKFQLTETDFTAFENSSTLYHLKDQEVRARVKQMVLEDRAHHPNSPGISKGAFMLIQNINAERDSFASEEINEIHSALGPAVATQLDEVVTAFYTSAQQGSRKAITAPSKLSPLVIGPSPLMPGEARLGVIADCSYSCTAATPSGSIELGGDGMSIAGSSTSTISSTDQQNGCYPLVIGIINPDADEEESSGGPGDSSVEVETTATVDVGNTYSETTNAYSCNVEACSEASTLTPTGLTTATPNTRSISPSSVVIGASGDISVTGTFLKPGGNLPTANVNGSGLTLNVTGGSQSNAGASTITLAYTVTPVATAGTDSFTLTDVWGTSNSENITVVCGAPTGISVSPSTWPAGVATKITISGTGFCNTSTVTVSVGSGTVAVSGATYVSSSTMTATVTPAACDPSESVTVAVTTPATGGIGGGVGSGTATITVAAAGAPTIMFNGANVAGTTANVSVGQEIQLSGTLPSQVCKTISTQQWSSPPGTAVGGYTATTTPPLGKAQPVPTNTTSASYGPFYWVTAGSLKMTYQYTLSSGAKSPVSTATFNVAGPASVKLYTCGGNVGAGGCTANGALGKVAINPGPKLQFGGTATNIGIEFTASATTPSGQFSWVQEITNDVITNTPSNGGAVQTCYPPEKPTAGVFPGLDTSYPYGYVGTPAMTNDNPSQGLTNVNKTVSRAFSAQMYLLWIPTAAEGGTGGSACTIPVPLGSVKWRYNGAAKLTNSANNTWAVTSGSGTANAFVASSTYPAWTSWVTYSGSAVCH